MTIAKTRPIVHDLIVDDAMEGSSVLATADRTPGSAESSSWASTHRDERPKGQNSCDIEEVNAVRTLCIRVKAGIVEGGTRVKLLQDRENDVEIRLARQ